MMNYSDQYEPLAREIAFNVEYAEKASEYIWELVQSCKTTNEWNILFIGTGINTAPELAVLKKLKSNNIVFNSIVYDNGYDDDMIVTTEKIFEEYSTRVVKRLPDPVTFDITKGLFVLTFTRSDSWIRKAHNIYAFMSKLWLLVGKQCVLKKEIPAIYDIAFVETLSHRNILGINIISSQKEFGSFKVYSLTNLLDNNYRDVQPHYSREYAIKYDCIDSDLCMNPGSLSTEKSERIKKEQSERVAALVQRLSRKEQSERNAALIHRLLRKEPPE